MFSFVYAPNIRTPKYIEQTLTDLKKKIESNRIIVGDFNVPLSTMHRTFRQKISKKIARFNNTIDQMDLIHIYKTFHQTAFSSSTHETFSRINHIKSQNIS